MLEATKPKRKYRPWYAVIRDENDGEMRVVRRMDVKTYDGMGTGEHRLGQLYSGAWVKVQESPDRDLLRAFCRLVHEREMYIPDTDSTGGSYYKYLPSVERDE